MASDFKFHVGGAYCSLVCYLSIWSISFKIEWNCIPMLDNSQNSQFDRISYLQMVYSCAWMMGYWSDIRKDTTKLYKAVICFNNMKSQDKSNFCWVKTQSNCQVCFIQCFIWVFKSQLFVLKLCFVSDLVNGYGVVICCLQSSDCNS